MTKRDKNFPFVFVEVGGIKEFRICVICKKSVGKFWRSELWEEDAEHATLCDPCFKVNIRKEKTK